MNKRSHAMESFSRLVVAMIVVLVGASALVFAFSMFNDVGCAVGIPCHQQPVEHPHY